MTIREAAPILGISERRLRQLCHQGRVRGARIKETERGPVWSIPVGENDKPVISIRDRGPLPRIYRGEM